ncbi:MAG TPA: acyl-CoA dehydrogenase family protein [Fimbriimonadales bacterium]|nr:acyl-CoA dehydrogenase family protein [Fimbriimonadales bacterium]
MSSNKEVVREGINPLVPGGSFLHDSPEEVFSPEKFDYSARMMFDTAKAFAENEVLPLLERLDKQEEGLMPSLVRNACELGFGGVDVPEKYGGLGLNKSVAVRILEALSVNGSFSTTIGVHTGVGQAPLVMFGNEEQKQKYLPPIVNGDWMGAYALSEPNSGSDALSLSAKAVREGNIYSLNGTKMWISNAKWANLFMTFAKINGEKFSCFLVERDFPGVSVSREEHKMGLKGSSTARLVLDDAKVPAENLLYKEGEGHKVAFNVLNIGRCKLAGMALGQCREALRQAVNYSKERKQFGKSISSFGLVRDKLARMTALIFGVESALYRTTGLLDDVFAQVVVDSPKGVEQYRQAAEEYQIECSLVKVLSTEVLDFCVDEALQIHGGYGFTEEFPVARLYRDARVMRIYEGTNEINRLFVFDRVFRKGLYASGGRVRETLSGVVSNLLQRAVAEVFSDDKGTPSERKDTQEIKGAMADLILLLYAQQAVNARLKNEVPNFLRMAGEYFIALSDAWAQSRIIELNSRLGTNEHLEPHGDWKVGEDVAEAVLELGGCAL